MGAASVLAGAVHGARKLVEAAEIRLQGCPCFFSHLFGEGEASAPCRALLHPPTLGVWMLTVPRLGLRLRGDLIEASARRVILLDVHIDGAQANQIGAISLRALGYELRAALGRDELIIHGAVRTTGARPGRMPGRLLFRR